MLEEIKVKWHFRGDVHVGGSLIMAFNPPEGDSVRLRIGVAISGYDGLGLDFRTDCDFFVESLVDFMMGVRELWSGTRDHIALFGYEYTCCLSFDMQDRGRGAVRLSCDFFYPTFEEVDRVEGLVPPLEAPTPRVGFLARSSSRLIVADAIVDAEEFQAFRDSYTNAIETWVR